jgi:ABC-type Fe3+ transport system substrate-binding protein
LDRISLAGFFAVAAVASQLAGPGAAQAQNVTPALKPSWDFMQQQMPGVPYSLLEAACKEGEVMIYHGAWGDAQDAQIAGFAKRFPCIKVRKQGGGMSDIRERFLSEFRAGQKIADIIQDSNASILDGHAASGYTAKYVISNDGKFDKESKNSGNWYSMRRGMAGIAWNTDLVNDKEAEKLKDWKGILDKRWTNVAAVGDISAGGVAYLPFYAWHKLYGDDFIKQLGPLNIRNISGTNNAAAALAAGDIQILFNASETALVPLYEKGAPIKWTLPPPGVGPLTGQAVTSNAPHPNAARLYQEYAFTVEGYTLFQKLGGVPTMKGIKDERDVAKESWYKIPDQIFDYSEKDAIAAVPGIVKLFNEYVAAARK